LVYRVSASSPPSVYHFTTLITSPLATFDFYPQRVSWNHSRQYIILKCLQDWQATTDIVTGDVTIRILILIIHNSSTLLPMHPTVALAESLQINDLHPMKLTGACSVPPANLI
jgi:hypothetical protein